MLSLSSPFQSSVPSLIIYSLSLSCPQTVCVQPVKVLYEWLEKRLPAVTATNQAYHQPHHRSESSLWTTRTFRNRSLQVYSVYCKNNSYGLRWTASTRSAFPASMQKLHSLQKVKAPSRTLHIHRNLLKFVSVLYIKHEGGGGGTTTVAVWNGWPLSIKFSSNHHSRLNTQYWLYRQSQPKKVHILPTGCIYVFCVKLRTNRDYFPIQLYLIGFHDRDWVCLLRGTIPIFR
jgi:hypothetical protein